MEKPSATWFVQQRRENESLTRCLEVQLRWDPSGFSGGMALVRLASDGARVLDDEPPPHQGCPLHNLRDTRYYERALQALPLWNGWRHQYGVLLCPMNP